MARIYKGTEPISFLDRVELILKPDYKPEDQQIMVEENTDGNGDMFTMKRIIKPFEESAYLLYRFDQQPGSDLFPFPYFNLRDKNGTGLGVAKACDYVLFAEKDDEKFIVLIELKKGKEDPIPQLEQMKYFVEFIQNRANRAGIELDANIRMVGISDEIHRHGTRYRDLSYDENDFAQLYHCEYIWLKDVLK